MSLTSIELACTRPTEEANFGTPGPSQVSEMETTLSVAMPRPSSASTLDVESQGDLSLSPLNDYLYAGVSLSRLDLEINQHTAKCMSESGWGYPLQGTEVASGDVIESPVEPTTFSALEQYREEFGYGIFARKMAELQAAGEQGSADVVRSPEEAASYELALYGSRGEGAIYPPGEEEGCLARALAEVTPGVPAYSTPLYEIIIENYLSEVLSSDQYRQALSSWQSCIAAAGYDFKQPSDVASYLEGLQIDELEAAERTLASVEWPCYRDFLFMPSSEAEMRLLEGLIESGDLPPAFDFEAERGTG